MVPARMCKSKVACYAPTVVVVNTMQRQGQLFVCQLKCFKVWRRTSSYAVCDLLMVVFLGPIALSRLPMFSVVMCTQPCHAFACMLFEHMMRTLNKCTACNGCMNARKRWQALSGCSMEIDCTLGVEEGLDTLASCI